MNRHRRAHAAADDIPLRKGLAEVDALDWIYGLSNSLRPSERRAFASLTDADRICAEGSVFTLSLNPPFFGCDRGFGGG